MSAMEKTLHQQFGDDGVRVRSFPQQAYDYDEPLDFEALRRHQAAADKELAGKKWRLIDGYDWSAKRELES